MRSILTFMLIAALLIAFTQPSFAETLTITSSVLNPATQMPVHSFTPDDIQFSPGQTITFYVTVTNTNTTPVQGLVVTDIFPQFITFVSGPGAFETNTKQISFPVPTLSANASQTFVITGTVMNASQIPTTNPTCVANTVFLNTSTGVVASQDTSQVCINPLASTVALTSSSISPTTSINSVTPTIIPPTQAPATGSTLVWLGLLPMGFAGFVFSKKAMRGIL